MIRGSLTRAKSPSGEYSSTRGSCSNLDVHIAGADFEVAAGWSSGRVKHSGLAESIALAAQTSERARKELMVAERQCPGWQQTAVSKAGRPQMGLLYCGKSDQEFFGDPYERS